MKNLKTLIVLLIFSLVLVACGGSEEVAEEPTAEPTVAPTEEPMEEEMVEEPTEEPMAEMNSIVDIAVADGRFTTLVAAVQAAGLAETLSGEGSFTVFAPTDDAFAALPEGTVESLLADPEGALTDVLLYHVVDGAVMAETVVTLDSATTLQGEDVTITVTDGSVFLNETVQVIITDIEASNGVIHVIDAVLLPPSMAAAEEEMAPSIAEIAVADGRFTTLVAALDAAGLVETLSGEGSFTVFAPTDDAFAALPEGTVASLLEDPAGALTDILLYHVVDGAVPAETVVTLESATTLQGEDVTITVTDGNVFLNDTVQVIITDIEASNGIIHVIDGVLLPPSMTAEELPSIAEIAVADGRFTTLVAALDAAGLVETLSGEGSFTVFAPTDDAFAALPEGTVAALLEDPAGALTDILLYHVVDGAVPAEVVVTLESATTLNGADVTITVTEDGEVFLNDTVQVIITDIQASNGIIHVIDGVLLP
ncbi:MAG: fasciclin domain-containing protein [Anaerolineaceae bacterium]|nr:fasciclin domain-containing protein [Anaerolineaceae bacterium]